MRTPRPPPALAGLALAAALGGAGRAAGEVALRGAAPAADFAAAGHEEANEVLCRVLVFTDGKPTELLCGGMLFSIGDQLEVRGSRRWWTNLVSAAVCVCVAAFAAGLTLGMISLDPFQLRVLCNRSVDDVAPASPKTRKDEQEHLLQEQRYAQKILPVISGHYLSSRWPHRLNPSNGHYLLVTLLLTNAAANEALPIFLNRLVPAWLAIILSVTVVLLFGEILPSAVFTGPQQLKLAASLVPLVRVTRMLFLPLVFPISLVLDACLGHEEEEHNRGEMKALARTLTELHGPEVNMIQGVLEMHAKAPAEISRPIASARMLAGDDVVSQETICKLLEWGHSRIFVYRRDPEDPARRDDILGVLLVKKLLGIPLEQGTRVDSCKDALKEPIVLGPSDNLLSTLNKFQEGMCHLAVVSDSPDALVEALKQGSSAPVSARAKMFCSLEDVIEAMMQEEIFDEADVEMGRARADVPVAAVPTSTILARADSLQSRRSRQSNSRYVREAANTGRLRSALGRPLPPPG